MSGRVTAGPFRSDGGGPAAEVVLPLLCGLLLVALGWVSRSPKVLGLVTVVVIVALGALVPGPPIRTGALAGVPAALGALAGAARVSGGVFVLALFAMPFVLLAAGLLATGGVLIGDYVREEAASRAQPARSDVKPARFETKVQRGRFLAALCAVLVAGSVMLNQCGAGAADEKAARRERDMARALAGLTAHDYGPLLAGAGAAPGGPYRTIRQGPDGLELTAEVTSALQRRCIRALVTADGRVTTDVARGHCR